MKKFFCFSVCMLVALVGAMDSVKASEKGCGIKSVVFLGFQGKDDNEFLYEGQAVYSAVEGGARNDLPGRVWECDNEYCPNHTIIEMPAGHYFKGVQQSDGNWYKCYGDEWHPFACGEKHVSFDGTQAAADDEFLYSNKASFEAASRGADSADLPGVAYECDNKHCLGGSAVTMQPGHVFEGVEIDKEVEYRCSTGGADKWVPVVRAAEAPACGEHHVSFDGIQVAKHNEFLYSDETSYNVAKNASDAGRDSADFSGLAYECDNDHCKDGTVVDMGPGHMFQGVKQNEKKSYLCKAGVLGMDDRWVLMTNVGGGEANPPVKPDPVVKKCEKGSDKILSQKNCRSDQTFKCEKTGDGGTCICGACYNKGNGGGGSTTACPEGSSSQITSPTKCKDGENFECAKWKGNVCQCGACKKPGQPVVEPEKPWDCSTMVTQMASLLQWQAECVGEATIMNQISNIMTMCTNRTMTKAVFESMFNSLILLKPEQCEDRSAAALIARKKKEISEGVSKIDSFVAGFDTSVWKDKDGDFNTARLASDSIAGVVLGTTGALVTSNIVKKNQVKGGFEDIQCVIGGQTVAGWGDEFQVGIQ